MVDGATLRYTEYERLRRVSAAFAVIPCSSCSSRIFLREAQLVPMFIFFFLAAIPIHDIARKTARWARDRRRHQLISTFER